MAFNRVGLRDVTVENPSDDNPVIVGNEKQDDTMIWNKGEIQEEKEE